MKPLLAFSTLGATFGRLTATALGLVGVAMTAVMGRWLLYEFGYGDTQHVHALLDRVLP